MSEIGDFSRPLQEEVEEVLSKTETSARSTRMIGSTMDMIQERIDEAARALGGIVNIANEMEHILTTEKEVQEGMVEQTSDNAQRVSSLLTFAASILKGTHNPHALSAVENLRKADHHMEENTSFSATVRDETTATAGLAMEFLGMLGATVNTLALLQAETEVIKRAGSKLATGAEDAARYVQYTLDELESYHDDIH